MEPIKKIIVMSDFYNPELQFVKTGANLRITHMLRKLGYEVLPIHHCTSFSTEELIRIIDKFSKGEQIAICISTSFLPTRKLKNSKYIPNTDNDPNAVPPGTWWGEIVFNFE